MAIWRVEYQWVLSSTDIDLAHVCGRRGRRTCAISIDSDFIRAMKNIKEYAWLIQFIYKKRLRLTVWSCSLGTVLTDRVNFFFFQNLHCQRIIHCFPRGDTEERPFFMINDVRVHVLGFTSPLHHICMASWQREQAPDPSLRSVWGPTRVLLSV